MSDKELIKICLGEISHKLGYSDTASLRQRDFEHVSEEIEKGTGILISISTIKRLLNGQFNNLPQAATLNAITTYLGYHSWQDLRMKKQGEINSTKELKPVPPGASQKSKKQWISYNVVVPATASTMKKYDSGIVTVLIGLVCMKHVYR